MATRFLQGTVVESLEDTGHRGRVRYIKALGSSSKSATKKG